MAIPIKAIPTLHGEDAIRFREELLLAICQAGKAQSIMSAAFIKKHHLPSASFVQGGIKGLLEKDFVTEMDGTYELYDKFFGEWLKRN